MQTLIDVIDREGVAHPSAKVVYHVEPGDPCLKNHPAAEPYAIVCDVIDQVTGQSILLTLHAHDVERLEQQVLSEFQTQQRPITAAVSAA